MTFGWYPTGLNSGHELEGNYLRGVDLYPDMLRPELARLPRIVYEFDSPDLRTGTMYPAMARTFRRWAPSSPRCSPTICCRPHRVTSAGKPTT